MITFTRTHLCHLRRWHPDRFVNPFMSNKLIICIEHPPHRNTEEEFNSIFMSVQGYQRKCPWNQKDCSKDNCLFHHHFVSIHSKILVPGYVCAYPESTLSSMLDMCTTPPKVSGRWISKGICRTAYTSRREKELFVRWSPSLSLFAFLSFVYPILLYPTL